MSVGLTCDSLADAGRWGRHLCCPMCHGEPNEFEVSAELLKVYIPGPVSEAIAATLCCTAITALGAWERP